MRIASIDLNVKGGTLTLHDNDGRSAKYRRVDSPFTLTTLHAICDSRGCVAMTSLLEADTFPPELSVKHDSPQQPPPGPVGVIGKWASEFRYVLEEK
jgi:hypothetical protein